MAILSDGNFNERCEKMICRAYNGVIKMVCGDITLQETDAIVNAANERLAHGGGVAGAIVRRGGRTIQQESDLWVKKNGLVSTGKAAITGGGELKARYVIHTVGPVMGSGDEDEKLVSAVHEALVLAQQYDLHSIAFPAISTGIFGYPAGRCARFMLNAVTGFLKTGYKITVIICLYDEKTYQIFIKECKNRNINIEKGMDP